MAQTFTASTNTDGWTIIATNSGNGTTYTLKSSTGVSWNLGSNPVSAISLDSSISEFNRQLLDGAVGYKSLSINGKSGEIIAPGGEIDTLLASISQMVKTTEAKVQSLQQVAAPAPAPTTPSTLSAYKAPPPIDSSFEGSLEFQAQTVSGPPVPAAIAAATEQVEGAPLTGPQVITGVDGVAPPTPLAIATLSDAPLVSTDEINADIANLQIELPDIAVDSDYAALYDTESQATQQDQANFEAKEDWRVRLSLAPDAEYLYNAKDPGILKPLATNGGTDGVIFPYTPAISVNYAANYEQTNIVHSNYKLFQYSGSGVDQVSISCTFTAQDEYEANYLLAVIHFFRTMTKMFYGQDENPKNGTPPPLCYMYGMGGYQFAAHPLAIQGFSYNLPDDVDYIKTTSESPAGAPVPSTTSPSEGRLAGTGVQKGGRGPSPSFQNTTKTEATTWVPTRIQMTITCVPIMSRNAISNRFSLRDYASGKLVLGTKEPGGGMW